MKLGQRTKPPRQCTDRHSTQTCSPLVRRLAYHRNDALQHGPDAYAPARIKRALRIVSKGNRRRILLVASFYQLLRYMDGSIWLSHWEHLRDREKGWDDHHTSRPQFKSWGNGYIEIWMDNDAKRWRKGA